MERALSSPSLLVIADDLTGANDVGVQFAKRGIATVVLAQAEAKSLPAGYEVVVVNTESRHCAPGEAADRVRGAARQGLAAGVRYFFKKTDSTLRGNIGAELEALLDATGERALAFVPAFPEMGRTTRAGIHYVDGVPISQTAFGSDPLGPIRADSVADVLRNQANIHIQSSAPGGVNDWAGCLVVDCESRSDMRSIAQWLARLKRLRVLAGSAAMAEELPDVVELARGSAWDERVRGPVLLVNGSLNPRALDQIARAGGEFHRAQLTPKILFESATAEEWSKQSCLRGTNVLLFSVQDRTECARFAAEAQKLGVHPDKLHSEMANATGRMVRRLLDRMDFGTLVVFGGDTLMGIARACGWAAFVPRTEVSAGITLATPLERELTVISKAGGFGPPDVITAISEWITARTPAGD